VKSDAVAPHHIASEHIGPEDGKKAKKHGEEGTKMVVQSPTTGEPHVLIMKHVACVMYNH
jgi:hypothetical protein